MVVTSFGRVEFDLARIPQAAGMDTGRQQDSFAARLDEHLEQETAAAPPAESAPAEPAAAAEPAPAVEPATAEAAATAAPAQAAVDAPAPMAVATQAIAASITPSGEPERRIKASEGSGSPLLSAPARKSAPVSLAEMALAQLARNGAPSPAATALATAAPAASAAARAADARIAGIADQAPLRAATAKVGATGYRTLTPQGIRLDEQARDSVFKQILFKLGKDGGEMRLRLEPPDLGELDLHLVVENGNALRLSIGTDRPDLRDLLQSGLGELAQRLQQNGLQIAHAEVHTRQRGQDAPQAGHGGREQRDADDEPAVARQPVSGTGWFAADGLDFWV